MNEALEKYVAVSLSIEQIEDLDRIAALTGKSCQDLLVKAVEDYLDKED